LAAAKTYCAGVGATPGRHGLAPADAQGATVLVDYSQSDATMMIDPTPFPRHRQPGSGPRRRWPAPRPACGSSTSSTAPRPSQPLCPATAPSFVACAEDGHFDFLTLPFFSAWRTKSDRRASGGCARYPGAVGIGRADASKEAAPFRAGRQNRVPLRAHGSPIHLHQHAGPCGRVHPPNKEVLKGIYLSFFPGAKIVSSGGNGAGKSTLSAHHGRRGQGLLRRGAAGRRITIGYLPQEPRLDPKKTVLGNVEEQLRRSRSCCSA